MEIFKIWRHASAAEKYRHNAIDYALNGRKVNWECYGVQTDYPKAIYQQMNVVSDFFGNRGKNAIFHFVISFEKKTVLDPMTALIYAKMIFEDLLTDHQAIISIHEEDHGTSLFHAHAVISTTNYITGELYYGRYEDLFKIAQNVANVTHNLCEFELPRPKENKDLNEDKAQDKKKEKIFKRIFVPKL